jgi:hypothetical protein
LEATRTALAPRKKFSFSARRAQQSQQSQQAPAAARPQAAAAEAPVSVSSAVAGLSLNHQQAPPQQEQQRAEAPAMEGFEGREGEELDLGKALGPDPPKDLLLKDLRRCSVRL